MVLINDIYRKPPPESEPENKKSKNDTLKSFITFLLVVIILYLGYVLIKSLDLKVIDGNTKIENISTSPEVSESTATATPTPTPEPTESAEATDTAESVNINKKTISIKVLNGSGKTGAASTIKTELEKQGFTVSATGTANNSYTQSVIYYKIDANKAKAQLVKDSLNSINCLLQKSSVAGNYDALVVVGKK